MFNAVKYIVSHRATFEFAARKLVRAAYEEGFVVSAKQITELGKWQVRKVGEKEDEDLTTEDSSLNHFDEID